MGIFSLDENPIYIENELKLNMITKIIEEYDFLSDTEKIALIKNILNGNITGV